MSVDPKRKELLYRKVQGKIRLPECKKKIELLLGTSILDENFLDLPSTDDIIIKLKSKEKSNYNELTFSSLIDCFDYISTVFSHDAYYLLVDDDWKYCGAYLMENRPKLNLYFDFNQVKADEIRFISLAFEMQISIDYCRGPDGDFFECKMITYV